MLRVTSRVDISLQACFDTLDTPFSQAIGLGVSTTGDSVINECLNQQLSEGVLKFSSSITDHFCTSSITREDTMQEMTNKALAIGLGVGIPIVVGAAVATYFLTKKGDHTGKVAPA